jgi:hypothetical protein
MRRESSGKEIIRQWAVDSLAEKKKRDDSGTMGRGDFGTRIKNIKT